MDFILANMPFCFRHVKKLIDNINVKILQEKSKAVQLHDEDSLGTLTVCICSGRRQTRQS